MDQNFRRRKRTWSKTFSISHLVFAKYHRFGKIFWELAERVLAEKKVKVHPVDIRPGGLKGVLEGMEEMRQGKVSGKKLVYKVAETP